MPVRLFVTATKIGGQVVRRIRSGPHDRLLPGDSWHQAAGNKSYLHSHMLGVMKEYRDAGVGRMLKLEQRKDAVARGIELMEWTFDPLEIKNAYFNIERLGAVVRRFVLNQYGTTSSALHAGLPTDRCVAEWRLCSPRVDAILGGHEPIALPHEARIAVPATIYEIKANDPAQAREIQKRVSGEFQETSRKAWR